MNRFLDLFQDRDKHKNDNEKFAAFTDMVTRKLNKIIELIKEGEERMSVQLENLTTEVAEIGTVVDSAMVLLETLSAKIVDLKDDPAALQVLADSLDLKAGELAAAIVANTVAEDEVVDEEDPFEPSNQ